MASSFKTGDVVQLKSGGPLGTITGFADTRVNVLYYNNVTGEFQFFQAPDAALRSANDMPEAPKSSFGNGGHRG